MNKFKIIVVDDKKSIDFLADGYENEQKIGSKLLKKMWQLRKNNAINTKGTT